MKDTVKRFESAKQMAGEQGVTLKEVYYLMGPYDALLIVEAPDDETVSRVTLAAGMQGNVRTVTMRAFTKAEMGALVAGLASP